jgi:tetratricopeptide (TPR) repeat protein
MLLIAAGCKSGSDQPEISQTVLQRQSADPKVTLLLIEAEDAFHQGAFGVALMLADSAERYAPELADIPFLRGLVYTVMIRFDEAEAAYNKVLELDPHYQGVWLNLGGIAFRQGQIRKALDWYRKEQEAYPSAVVLLQMGRAYAELREADRARKAYLQAIAADSSYATVYFRLSELYKEEGELEKALEYSRQGLTLDPDNLNYQYFVGSLLLLTGEIEEAVGYLQTVVAQYPWHYWAHYNLGQALLRQGRQDEGKRYLAKADSLQEGLQNIEEWQTLAEQNPDQFMLWVNLGEAFRRAGRIDKAINAHQIAFNLGPQNLALQNNLANMYLMRGDTTWAIAGYRLILRQDPTYAGAWFNLGVIYNSTGKVPEARWAFESALMYEPDDSAAKAYLAKLPDTP